jgi:hypothetical protein
MYMGVHVMAEGAVVSRGPVPLHPKLVQSFRGKSGGEEWDVNVFEVRESSAFRVWHLVMVQRVGECTYEQG